MGSSWVTETTNNDVIFSQAMMLLLIRFRQARPGRMHGEETGTYAYRVR